MHLKSQGSVDQIGNFRYLFLGLIVLLGNFLFSKYKLNIEKIHVII